MPNTKKFGHSPVKQEQPDLVGSRLRVSVSYPRNPAPNRTFPYRPVQGIQNEEAVGPHLRAANLRLGVRQGSRSATDRLRLASALPSSGLQRAQPLSTIMAVTTPSVLLPDPRRTLVCRNLSILQICQHHTSRFQNRLSTFSKNRIMKNNSHSKILCCIIEPSMKIVLVKPRYFNQCDWVSNVQAAAIELHGPAQSQFLEHTVDMNGRHSERVRKDQLG